MRSEKPTNEGHHQLKVKKGNRRKKKVCLGGGGRFPKGKKMFEILCLKEASGEKRSPIKRMKGIYLFLQGEDFIRVTPKNKGSSPKRLLGGNEDSQERKELLLPLSTRGFDGIVGDMGVLEPKTGRERISSLGLPLKMGTENQLSFLPPSQFRLPRKGRKANKTQGGRRRRNRWEKKGDTSGWNS